MLCVIINTGQKNSQINISPMRAGGEIGENFLLVKISGYTVHRVENGVLMHMCTIYAGGEH